MKPGNLLANGLLLALALCAANVLAAAEPLAIGGEPALAPKAEPAATWAMAAFPQDRVAAHALAPMDPKRILEVQERNARRGNAPVQLGINRALTAPLPSLEWVAVAGGFVAHLQLTSPDALGMRVGLDLSRLPGSAELRFAGDLAPGRITRVPVAKARKLLAEGLYWSPPTDGATQVIEVFVPGGTEVTGLALAAPEVSHLLTNGLERFSLAKAIGTSAACNVDTRCREEALGQDFINAKNAVTLLMFTERGSFGCTGTLLNETDPDTQIPYVWTTHYCPRFQAAANTLVSYWGFEATACGSGVAAEHVVLGGGAEIVFVDEYRQPGPFSTESAILRLNEAPPAGAYYAGWNTASLARGDSVLSIQHPFADLKKSSLGQMRFPGDHHYMVGWASGTAAWEDQGAGLFTLGVEGYQLRGGLVDSFASCANSGDLSHNENLSHFSRFDAVWPYVKPYLDPELLGPRPTRNYTGAWYSPEEPGWGLTLHQYPQPQHNLFAMFFIYDQAGQAQWFELEGSWSATDVHSGNLLQSTAGPWGPAFNPANRQFAVAGNATLTFTSNTTANVTFTVNGTTRTISLQKL